MRARSKFDRYMVPPEVHQAFNSNQSVDIAGDKVDIFQCGVLMFLARYRHLPFLEATMADPHFRLWMKGTGTFRNEVPEYLSEHIRNSQKPDKEEAFLSLVLQMMNPNPEDRPAIRLLLARPIW
jgi:serine/threonine protein kinase